MYLAARHSQSISALFHVCSQRGDTRQHSTALIGCDMAVPLAISEHVLFTLHNQAPVYSVSQSHTRSSGLLVQAGLFRVFLIYPTLTLVLNQHTRELISARNT